jgi:hypothetical protein
MLAEESKEFEVTKAVAAVIPLGESNLDVYMLPSGEKRLGIEATGIALGYTDRWFYNRTKRKSKWLETLKRKGFTGAQKSLQIIRQDDRGSSIGRTISIRDFVKLVFHEAILSRNQKAIVLLAAFMEVGLERTIEDVFAGRSVEFILDKILHYSKWTYEELEQVLAENRADARSLHFWGDTNNSSVFPPSLDMFLQRLSR